MLKRTLLMEVCSEEAEAAEVYHDLISDHKDVIIREIDIDEVMRDYPYKEAISKSEFIKLFNETDKREKSKRFINNVLKRNQPHELKAFLKMVTKEDNQHYLKTVLRNRLTRPNTTQNKIKPHESNSETSEGPSLPNGLSDLETPHMSLETKHSNSFHRSTTLHNMRSAADTGNHDELRPSMSSLQREKEHLEENLTTAELKIQNKTGVIDFLLEEKNELSAELERAKRKIENMQRELHALENVNSELREHLQGAKVTIESFQTKLSSNSSELKGVKEEVGAEVQELKGVKEEVQELKGELTTVSEQLEQLKPLRQILQEPKRSRACLLM